MLSVSPWLILAECCHVDRRKISEAGGDSADFAAGFARRSSSCKGFLHGLHASPFHGFSVEFSEHRKYTPGDDPHDIDWLVYAKTDKYYVKKFEAETNITGYLAMDLSESMAYTYRQELTKFDYAICLAAALSLFDDSPERPGRRGDVCASRSRITCRRRASGSRSAISCRCWRKLQPGGEDGRRPQPHPAGGDAEALQPGDGVQRSAGRPGADHRGAAAAAAWRARRDPVSHSGRSRGRVSVFGAGGVGRAGNARRGWKSMPTAIAAITCRRSKQFRETYRRECFQSGIDYVPLDTSMPFDRALTEYLVMRQSRG